MKLLAGVIMDPHSLPQDILAGIITDTCVVMDVEDLVATVVTVVTVVTPLVIAIVNAVAKPVMLVLVV